MSVDFEISPLLPETEKQPAPAIIPEMPKISNSKRYLKLLILVAVGLFVITVGSLWWGGNSFSDKDVVVTVAGPDRATSGDEATYTVKWQNNTKLTLSSLSFRIFYPEGSIVLKDGQPTKPDSEGFQVERLESGQSGSREFKLFLVGDKGSIKAFRTHLIYVAGNLKSEFEKDITASTTITNLPANLALVAPPTAVAGQPIQYILDIRNDSPADLNDLQAVFKYPDGFVVQKMQPQPDTGNTLWLVDSLKAGQATRITVTGVLAGNERETKTVQVVLQQKLNGQYVDYVRTEAFTVISSQPLTVTLTPKDGRDYVSFAGDTLRYTVTYANNSRYTLLGLTLAVKLEGSLFDFARVQADKGFFDDNTKTVNYDSSGLPELASLPPGQSGRVTFSVPLKSGFEGQGGAKSFFVKASAHLATNNVPLGLDGDSVFADDSLITKISTQPTLSQSLLYDNGAGTGPLPLKVGQETTLTVRWQLTNPGNDVRETKIVATLPPGVTFKGSATATNGTPPVFDHNSNKLTWTVGLLPFGTGNGTARYEAKFQISLTPASNQQGTSPKLVVGTVLTGSDSFTGQAVQLQIRDYDTASIEDHPKDGQVQP